MTDAKYAEFIALRDGQIASLSYEGQVVGHLACQWEQGWGSGKPFGSQTFAWFLVTLDDGRQYAIEDYPPYATTPDLAAGRLEDERALGDSGAAHVYEVRWLPESEQVEAAAQFGFKDIPGSYRFEGTVAVEWWWSRLSHWMRGRQRSG